MAAGDARTAGERAAPGSGQSFFAAFLSARLSWADM